MLGCHVPAEQHQASPHMPLSLTSTFLCMSECQPPVQYITMAQASPQLCISEMQQLCQTASPRLLSYNSVRGITSSTLDDVRQYEVQYNEEMAQVLKVFQGLDDTKMFSLPDLDRLIEIWQRGKAKKFSIIGDNLDILLRTKQMSKDKQNTDIHWFLMYAIMDEIYDSTLSEQPVKDFKTTNARDFIPSEQDQQTLHGLLTILWSRIIVKTIPEFNVLEISVVYLIRKRNLTLFHEDCYSSLKTQRC